jgi:hypothetical protein
VSVAGIMASSALQQGLASVAPPVQPVQSGGSGSSQDNQFIGLPLPAPIRTDLTDLSTALQKGDMEAAQTAFSSLIADLSAQYQTQSESSISLLG